MSDAIRALAHFAGIYDDYWDQKGVQHQTGPDTDRALLAAMGLQAETDALAEETLARLRAEADARALPAWLILENDQPSHHALAHSVEAVRLTLEDGTEQRLAAGDALDLPAMPLGIHVLDLDGRTTTLLVGSASLPLPERSWGVTLPLYGLRTTTEGGIGTYRDLGVAVTAIAPHGASFIGLNPVHAGFPTDPNASSPYSPSHRRRLCTTHIARTEKTASDGGALIDYPGVFARHRAETQATFEAFEAAGGDAGFETWLAQDDGSLERFATHQALSDAHGPYWCNWPAAFQDAQSAEVAAFRATNAAAIRYHSWLQWQAETQLKSAAERAAALNMGYGLYLDLAVGTHPHGAETWGEGDVFASGVSLGAPPDAFSPDGQVWALAPFNPHRLAQMHFRPLAETLRRQLQYSGLLRIDHILGFERAFWVPTDRDAPGTYVVMPRDAMLAVVRIEAARAGATVIGEDLGNVPDGLQDAMAGSGVLGCRLVMFEQAEHGNFRAASEYTEAALASFGTHDVPTWAGWRSALDVKIRHELGYLNAVDFANGLEWRQFEVAGFDALTGSDAPSPDAMHRFLGEVKSALVALRIEDILDVEEQANLPGTVDTHPNWRRRLPVSATDLAGHPAILRAAQIMKETGRQE